MSIQFQPKYSVADPDQNLRMAVELLGKIVAIGAFGGGGGFDPSSDPSFINGLNVGSTNQLSIDAGGNLGTSGYVGASGGLFTDNSGLNADGSASFAGGLTTIGTNGSMSIGSDPVSINSGGYGDIVTAGPITCGYIILNDGGAASTLYADESGGFSVGGNIAANGLILPNAASVMEGDFDNGTGGANGISLNCSLGYELNWQGGRLRAAGIGTGGTPIPLVLDSDLTIGATSFAQDGSALFAGGNFTITSSGTLYTNDSIFASGALGAGSGAVYLSPDGSASFGDGLTNIYNNGSASFASGASGNDYNGVIYCNNPVTPTALTVADSKVAMTIGGVTYYLLATTDPT